MQRTSQQNKAIHVACQGWAEGLTLAGYDVKKAMDEGKMKAMPIPFTKENVKTLFVHPYLVAMYPDHVDKNGNPTTTKLETFEIEKLFDAVNDGLAQVFGVSISFPSEDVQRVESLTNGN